MADDELHELRRQAHDAGIQGNSKKDEQQLREALHRVDRGENPTDAKHEAKGET